MIISITGNSKKESPDIDTDPSDKNIANDDELQTGNIQDNTFDNKEVKYRIVNGMAIFEGDIILAATPKETEQIGNKKVKGIGKG